MPYEQLKVENFNNMGGINIKASPYEMTQEQFLDLVNVEGNKIGSLTKRPGSTQMLSSGTSGRITGLFEYELLTGPSYIIACATTQAYFVQANALTPFQSGLSNNDANYSIKTFVNYMFYCNGSNFMKWNGGTYVPSIPLGGNVSFGSTSPVQFDSSLFSLPPGPSFVAGFTTATFYLAQSSVAFASGVYVYSLGWMNRRGYIGPPGPAVTLTIGITGTVTFGRGYSFVGGDTTIIGFTVPPSFAIGAFTLISYAGLTAGFTSPLNLVAYRSNGTNTQLFFLKTFSMWDDYTIPSSEQGALFRDFNDVPLGITPAPTAIFFTLAPQFIEVYQNRLFMGGFTQAPSTIAFSDLAEPESIQPEDNFEVRTNDSDSVRGMIEYNNRLVIFKERSFHILTGDNPANFDLNMVSNQYGCLSHKAAAIYENILLFLDQKGIVEFNGANVRVISTPVEDLFKRMNVASARQKAMMIHHRIRNQVWCSFPIDSSTINNMTVVYDYVTGSWYKFEGFQPSYLSVIRDGLAEPSPVFGNYSGMLHNFSPSLLGDNGNGITCIIKTRFIASEGNSVQKMYRRAWFNFDPVSGTSTALDLQFFQDYGASTVLSRTIVQNPFQTRIDFGVSAKALSIQVRHFSSTENLVLHGYVLGYRYLRNT